MARIRDPNRTRRTILDAATVEFGALGLAGARVDTIARSAGINKRMLYHYFGSKDGLFAAVLADRRGTAADTGSGLSQPAASLTERHLRAAHHPEGLRLLMWEALAEVDRLAAPPDRDSAWSERTADVGVAQRAGRLPSDLDAAQLELTFAAIALFPFAFPQVTESITGHSPATPAFVTARAAFLSKLDQLFAGGSVGSEPAKPRYRRTAAVTEPAQPGRQIDASTSK